MIKTLMAVILAISLPAVTVFAEEVGEVPKTLSADAIQKLDRHFEDLNKTMEQLRKSNETTQAIIDKSKTDLPSQVEATRQMLTACEQDSACSSDVRQSIRETLELFLGQCKRVGAPC